jgi:hypothetical protein
MLSKCRLFYVNSFPRSGNTWIRNLLIDLIDPIAIDVNPIFSKCCGLINNHKIPKVRIPKLTRAKFGMIKSHGRYETTKTGIPIIYLVRDGRDALISYYHFNVDHRGYTEDFNSYFNRHICENRMISYREKVLRIFMGNWCENSLSYINKENVLIIRYEDLIRDTISGIHEMLNFIGAKVDSKLIENSVEENRKILNDKNSRHDRPRGVAGNWRTFMTTEQQNQFVEFNRDALDLYGYNPDFVSQKSVVWRPLLAKQI